MSSELKTNVTVQQYLTFERRSQERHEFVDGDLFAMTGASEPHNQIVFNLGGEFRTQFKSRSCRAYLNDMRVRISGLSRYYYPDLVALCDDASFEDEELDTLLNPALIIEVLSSSTEAHDRGAKFEDYRRIDTLKEYVLVSQAKPLIEQFRKQSDGLWLFSATRGLESTVELASVSCQISLAEIYDKVQFNR